MLFEYYYNAPTIGYKGIKKIEKRVARYYYWQGLRSDVKDYINNYISCVRTKARRHRPYGELVPLPVLSNL
jgi:hypothetical protein